MKLDKLFERANRQTARALGSMRKKRAGAHLLPRDLAEQIIEAAETEHDTVLARVDEIDAELLVLDERIAEARRAEDAAMTVLEQTPVKRARLDGRGERVIKRPPVRIRGKEAVEAGKVTRALVRRRTALLQEKRGHFAQLAEIARVQQAAKRGVVTALLHITANWRNQVIIGPRILLRSQSVETDAFGNQLS